MKLRMHTNQIIHKTEKSYLVKLPKTELAFWCLRRFCTITEKGYGLEIWFGDSFTIEAKRTDKKGNILESWKKSVKEVATSYGIPYSE